MKKFGWLILVLSLMTYPQATTWEGFLFLSLPVAYEFHFSKPEIVKNQQPSDTVDLVLTFIVEQGHFLLHGLDTLPEYIEYKTLFVVKDSNTLDFTQLIDTSSLTFDKIKGQFVLDQGAYYPHEDIFFFRLTNKNWALCHSTYEDSIYIGQNSSYTQAVRMYLACQVQDDGTTKFDSIPQYPHIPVASMPRARSFVPFLNEGRYQANGRNAFQASGVQLGRLGVQPELRK